MKRKLSKRRIGCRRCAESAVPQPIVSEAAAMQKLGLRGSDAIITTFEDGASSVTIGNASRKKARLLLAIVIVFSLSLIMALSGCTDNNAAKNAADQLGASDSISAIFEDDTDLHISESVNHEDCNFSNLEEAYYYKYCELAEKHGTHALYDVRYDYHNVYGRSYLKGVCIVNLIDFNADGVEDLFIVYSNGQLERVVNESYGLEVFDFPSKDAYEIEIWTYEDGALKQLLHESSASTYDASLFWARDPNDIVHLDYRFYITVFENEDGFPVIQKHNYYRNGAVCEYENIYYAGETISRDRLSYADQFYQMNDSEVSWEIWIDNVAGYDKILLSAPLAFSRFGTSTRLNESYGINYDYALVQTQRVVRYLSNREVPTWFSNWFISEGAHISLYMKELHRSNFFLCESEGSEKHYTNHHYALYDIDQNGMPELILYEGSSGAGMHFHFYAIDDGGLIYVGSYGRTSLEANYEGGLVAYTARMGNYYIDFLSFEDGEIKTAFIASGTTGQAPFPELHEFGYENYGYLPFCPPEIPMVFYTHNQSLSID